MPPRRPEGPNDRAIERLSSEERERVRDVAERMENGWQYYDAVRQVMANDRVTDRRDLDRAYKRYSRPVDEARADLQAEAAERAADEADIDAAIEAERDQQLRADMDRVRRERGGDPDD